MPLRIQTRPLCLYLLIVSGIVFPIFGGASECQARRWFARSHRPVPRRNAMPSGYVKTDPVQADWRRRHDDPRYYGGFHVRYFETIGVPSGDIGLRGNGIYLNPW